MLQLTTVFFLIASSILAVVHNIALQLFLYWRFWWLDIPVHILGGIVVALGTYAAYDLRLLKSKKLLRLVPILTIVLLIAIGWEVYEVAIGIPIEDDYFFDTGLDLAMGLLGGFLGHFVASRVRKL